MSLSAGRIIRSTILRATVAGALLITAGHLHLIPTTLDLVP